MSNWQAAIEKEWNDRRRNESSESVRFPLIAQSFDHREIIAGVDTLLTGRITMASRVLEFERKFAEKIGSPYAVMVNSGSSANLLALAVASNPARSMRLRAGDEILVPSVCWSTSVWPILQLGMKPVFVDVDPGTLNVSLSDLKNRITPKTRGMMIVHILGNSAPMGELLEFARERNFICIEDTCESLGSRYQHKFLGTFADFGCYSFYYSHHITTGEGGMVTCRTLEDYDLLKCLRAHGWSRELSNRKQVEERHSDVDPRFLFINTGFNLRPSEVQAAFGLCQLERMDGMNETRNRNRSRLIEALERQPKWKSQFDFPKPSPGTEPAWFGFPLLFSAKLKAPLKDYLRRLSEQGIENRPIVSGNFTRQPGLRLHGIDLDPRQYPGAETIGTLGFFIGLHTEPLSDLVLDSLAETLLQCLES